MPQSEIFICEFLTIDGLSTSPITSSEITTLPPHISLELAAEADLAHETGNNAVEDGSLVVKGLAASTRSFLSRTQGTEILGGSGDCIREELKQTSTQRQE